MSLKIWLTISGQSMGAHGSDQKSGSVDSECAFQILAEEAEPRLLGAVGHNLTFSRAGKAHVGDRLEVMHHLMHEE